jgi:DNA-binding NtrC family response regulator
MRTIPRDQILVVDDDQGVREALDALLGDDFDVRQAEGVDSALRVLETISPRLVFLDLRLDGASGLDLLRHLARERPRLPVVMVTAASDEAALGQLTALGARGVVRKPFDITDIEAFAHASPYIR